MKISIIIPALNECENIQRAVITAWEAGAAEVIVVDGGSSDDTVAVASQNNCRVITSQRGRAWQLNAGARACSGEVLLFQHADNWLAADAVAQILDALASPQVLGGAFYQRIESPQYSYRLLEWGNAFRVRYIGLPLGDQGMFVRRHIFQQVGGFPDVELLEDYLLMKKLRQHARPILLPGPIHVNPRRWQKHGVIRQTLRNWSILMAYQLGVTPNYLARFYARHDLP